MTGCKNLFFHIVFVCVYSFCISWLTDWLNNFFVVVVLVVVGFILFSWLFAWLYGWIEYFIFIVIVLPFSFFFFLFLFNFTCNFKCRLFQSRRNTQLVNIQSKWYWYFGFVKTVLSFFQEDFLLFDYYSRCWYISLQEVSCFSKKKNTKRLQHNSKSLKIKWGGSIYSWLFFILFFFLFFVKNFSKECLFARTWCRPFKKEMTVCVSYQSWSKVQGEEKERNKLVQKHKRIYY